MKSEGEFVPGCARHESPFFIWYTYPQLLLKNAAPRPGSNLDRHGGSILGRRQHHRQLNLLFVNGWRAPCGAQLAMRYAMPRLLLH